MSRNYYRHLIGGDAPAPTGGLYDNAIVYYKLDETSGQAIDSISGFNGILNGGVNQGVPGKIGTAYGFNGVDSYVNIGDLNLNIENAYSLSAWVKANSGQIIGRDGDGTNRFWQFRILGDNTLNFIRFNNSGGATVSISGGYVDDSKYYHVVATFFRAFGVVTSRIYVDGIEVANDSSTQENNTGTGAPIYLGAYSRGGGANFLTGNIDEASIFPNYALSSQEVSNIYNNGQGTTI